MKSRLMKKLFLALMVMTLLDGCATPASTEESTLSVSTVDIEKEASGEGTEENQEEEMPDAAAPETSGREITISYAGDSFEKSLFATGGERLWLYGVKEGGGYFLGNMGIEEDVFQEADLNPGNREIFTASVKKRTEQRFWKNWKRDLRLCNVELPKANAIYTGVYAGTDTELLLFNKDSGVFAVQDCGSSAENRVSGAELLVTGERISQAILRAGSGSEQRQQA